MVPLVGLKQLRNPRGILGSGSAGALLTVMERGFLSLKESGGRVVKEKSGVSIDISAKVNNGVDERTTTSSNVTTNTQSSANDTTQVTGVMPSAIDGPILSSSGGHMVDENVGLLELLVRNTWGKYGLVKSMLNSSTGIFSFQYSFMEGLDAMLKNGPWFIRNNPLILKKWNPDVSLLKEDVGNLPVWVKLYFVPMTTFSKDGLSAIDTKLGTPLMLDSYTSDMCIQSWGSGNKKKDAEPIIEVSNSNPFDVLNSVENDADLGTNGGASNLASKKANSSGSSFWNVDSSSISTTPIIEKIDKIERIIIDGKVTLVDDEGKPLTRVDSSGDHDSEDEVASVDNDMANFLASKDVGYGQDILDKIQDICDNSDINVRGRKKK
ncbi:hypothetical protein Tco_0462484 [Tanacetum coccineum]